MITETIKTLRKSFELTQAQLARSLGVTRSSVNAWEMGVSTPSVQTLVQLSNFFDVSFDFLLGIPRRQSIGVEGLTPEEISIVLRMLSYFRSRHSV